MDTRSVRTILVVSLLAVALAGCSDMSGLLPRFEEDSVARLELITPGTAVRSLFIEEITPHLFLTGEYLSNPPNKVEISILNADGDPVAILDPILGDLTDVLTSFNLLPADLSLSAGLYSMEYSLYLDAELIQQEQIPFFFAPNFASNVTVSTYPSVLVAGGYGLLRAQVLQGDSAADYDPYLRWEKDGKVLSEGYLSEGANITPVLAPASAGVFKATLSVYPFGPDEGEYFDFLADLENTVEAVVDTTPRTGPNDLGPDSEFYTLLHFNGTLNDTGDAFDAEYKPIEEPVVPGVRNQFFGLEYNPSQYLISRGFALPRDDDGLLYAASLHWIGVVDFLPVGQAVSLFSTELGDWSFGLLVREDGALVLRIVDGDKTSELVSDPGTILEEETSSLVISYYPTDEGIGFVALKNGYVATRGVLKVTSAIADGEGSTIVGGSFSGIIDEFGIRYKSGERVGVLSGGVYLEALESQADVEFALSFESGEPVAYRHNVQSAGLRSLPFQGGPGLNFSPGAVAVDVGASLRVDELALRYTENYLWLEFNQESLGPGVLIQVSPSDSPENAVEVPLLAAASESSAKVALERNGGVLRVLYDSGQEDLAIDLADGESATIAIVNNSTRKIILHSVAVVARPGDSIANFLASLDAE